MKWKKMLNRRKKRKKNIEKSRMIEHQEKKTSRDLPKLSAPVTAERVAVESLLGRRLLIQIIRKEKKKYGKKNENITSKKKKYINKNK